VDLRRSGFVQLHLHRAGRGTAGGWVFEKRAGCLQRKRWEANRKLSLADREVRHADLEAGSQQHHNYPRLQQHLWAGPTESVRIRWQQHKIPRFPLRSKRALRLRQSDKEILAWIEAKDRRGSGSGRCLYCFSSNQMSLARRLLDRAIFCRREAPVSHKTGFWFRIRERPGCPGAGIFDEGFVGTMTGRKAENPGETESPRENPPSTSEKGKSPSDVTEALEEIMPLVYEELRRLAGGYLSKERPEHTLQRTALVHEAYLRLAGQDHVSWENPANLLAIFARLMRQTLINHAVARTRAKRGGSNPTEVMLEFYDRHEIDVTAVDEALRELEALDSRQAQIVEFRFFGGLTVEEIAALLEISPATVKREWSVAKLWLRKALAQPS